MTKRSDDNLSKPNFSLDDSASGKADHLDPSDDAFDSSLVDLTARRCDALRSHYHHYVENELDPLRVRMVDAHLGACDKCREEVEYLQLEKLWVMETVLDAPELSDRLTEKIVAAVHAERRDLNSRWFLRVSASIAAVALAGVLAVFAGGASIETPEIVSEKQIHLPPGTIHVRSAGKSRDRNELPRARLVHYNASSGISTTHGYPWTLPAPRRHAARCDYPASAYRVAVRVKSPRDRIRKLTPLASRADVVVFVRMPRRGRISLRDTVNVALRFARGTPAVERDLESCEPDPNADGKLDIDDIAYGLQVLYGAQTPEAVALGDESSQENECDAACARA